MLDVPPAVFAREKHEQVLNSKIDTERNLKVNERCVKEEKRPDKIGNARYVKDDRHNMEDT